VALRQTKFIFETNYTQRKTGFQVGSGNNFLNIARGDGRFPAALPRCPAISACARRWGRTCQQRSRDKDTFAPPARIFQARPWKSVFSSSIHVDHQPLGTLATVEKWVDMSIESKYSMADGENKSLFQRKV